MHCIFPTYIWYGISPNWMSVDIFRKAVFICLEHAVTKWLAATIFPCQEKETYELSIVLAMYIELQTLKRSAAFAVQAVTDVLHASPKPGWKRWIVMFRAIKRLPKFSIAAAAHITDCTRLCKDWAQAPFYHKWNDTAWLLHSLTSGSACMARRSLLPNLRRDESFRGPW